MVFADSRSLGLMPYGAAGARLNPEPLGKIHAQVGFGAVAALRLRHEFRVLRPKTVSCFASDACAPGCFGDLTETCPADLLDYSPRHTWST